MTIRPAIRPTLRRRAALAAGLAVALVGALTAALPTAPAVSAAAPLTNLTHLDFLQDDVAPPTQANHTTYDIGTEAHVGVLWTYADRQSDGTFHRVGGGAYNPTTDTYGQGAYNADDIARAAVVYLRHWKQTGATTSRTRAYELLRGLTYLQDASGPDAGNVVLWMQHDGTLTPSATPKDDPDPSDSADSYWLARTVWALGEGYADFAGSGGDPVFASFLRDRLDLAVGAMNRENLARYGTFQQIDGTSTPAWLIAHGADASAEAALGLSAYVTSNPGDAEARTALRQLSAGIAAMSGGDARTWPFGAVLPWTLSLADWHAWASQMPEALARASTALGDPSLAAGAARDSATFDPWLLTSGGPDNGRLPTRIDASQISYGVDSRLQSLLATADATGSQGDLRLAGIVAAWYFGANASGQPAYDPATGETVDGISPDGGVNHNGGAESTIHGLLSMLALDAHPAVAALARTAAIHERVGTVTVQAETSTLGGGAHAVAPSSTWTGESQYGGSGYAALPSGGTASMAVGSGQPRLVMAVVELQPGSTAVTTFRAGDTVLGRVRSGDIGPQGDSPAPGALLPVTLTTVLPPGQSRVTATTTATGGDEARLDALMVEPLVSRLVLGGDGHGTALLRSASSTDQHVSVSVPGSGPATVERYDGTGRLVGTSVSKAAGSLPVSVPAGGFTIVRR